MSRSPQDCKWCGEGIVMLQDPARLQWIPVSVETWTSGENVFDSNVHTRHDCAKRVSKISVDEDFKDLIV